ncbi:uncharacterized protein BDR25DRAFT_133035 [Lindgomyces ingoldianus]|uniref:Uncharacterized protein n=1 Tax=Lindgomyces ingoldianus TaxID=673940 RepID=A0ACB6Q6X3_9PLEO|nr:uncharacterized protein BDR25DRAFT_133035 [Lindgomyces ingoldianus]KAF2462527.1 hypothetical protein BDR25DRAFT_133035 [Lindgomyces ingoldianus]
MIRLLWALLEHCLTQRSTSRSLTVGQSAPTHLKQTSCLSLIGSPNLHPENAPIRNHWAAAPRYEERHICDGETRDPSSVSVPHAQAKWRSGMV